jgi:hypothetical protein
MLLKPIGLQTYVNRKKKLERERERKKKRSVTDILTLQNREENTYGMGGIFLLATLKIL